MTPKQSKRLLPRCTNNHPSWIDIAMEVVVEALHYLDEAMAPWNIGRFFFFNPFDSCDDDICPRPPPKALLRAHKLGGGRGPPFFGAAAGVGGVGSEGEVGEGDAQPPHPP